MKPPATLIAVAQEIAGRHLRVAFGHPSTTPSVWDRLLGRLLDRFDEEGCDTLTVADTKLHAFAFTLAEHDIEIGTVAGVLVVRGSDLLVVLRAPHADPALLGAFRAEAAPHAATLKAFGICPNWPGADVWLVVGATSDAALRALRVLAVLA